LTEATARQGTYLVLVVAALVTGSALPYKLIEPLAGETDNGPEAELHWGPVLGLWGSTAS